MSDWFYSVSGSTQGPVTSSKLRELAKAGAIGQETMVWKEGMGSWVPAMKLKGLFPGPGAVTGSGHPPPSATPSTHVTAFEPFESLPQPQDAGVPLLLPPAPLIPASAVSANRRPISDYGVLRYVGSTVSTIGWSIVWLAIFLSTCISLGVPVLFMRFPSPAVLVGVIVAALTVATVARVLLPLLAKHSVRWFGFALQLSIGLGFLVLICFAAANSGSMARMEALMGAVGIGLVPVLVGVLGIVAIGVGEFLQASADVASNSWRS